MAKTIVGLFDNQSYAENAARQIATTAPSRFLQASKENMLSIKRLAN